MKKTLSSLATPFALLILLGVSFHTWGATLLVVGDSLSAGYGLGPNEGWVTLLKQRLAKHHADWTVVNASISGETTAGGRSRVPALLRQYRPEVVIVELGGNDGLRGLPLHAMYENLADMIRAAQASRARVLLLGMRLPPNYGDAYIHAFVQVYQRLANRYRLVQVPFMLQDLIGREDLFQSDRIHPTAAAQPLILNRIWPYLEPLIRHPRTQASGDATATRKTD